MGGLSSRAISVAARENGSQLQVRFGSVGLLEVMETVRMVTGPDNPQMVTNVSCGTRKANAAAKYISQAPWSDHRTSRTNSHKYTHLAPACAITCVYEVPAPTR